MNCIYSNDFYVLRKIIIFYIYYYILTLKQILLLVSSFNDNILSMIMDYSAQYNALVRRVILLRM